MLIVRSFPILALLAAVLGFWFAELFAALKSWIVPLLTLVMLGMGLSLKWHDFVAVWQKKQLVAIGVGLQFVIMPLSAWLLSLAFNLSTEWMIGMILVGATAGGTASNVMAYLAKGDVALSVSMTLISTLAAVVLLPMLTWLYLDQTVDVPAGSMLWMMVKIVLLPLIIGMIINRFFHRQSEVALKLFPLISVATILLIIAIVVALNANNMANIGIALLLAVMLHNLIGLAAGYFVSIQLGYDSVVARTVAIEVAMQNSGLSVALAIKYFGAASALPGAIFSVWHNISGSIFAAFWQRYSQRHSQNP
ncbi:bile acid:sodium symporter family protein [Thiomicrorhabdus sediminis]|uniref:Bile acid:sodium symporter family protein n=1 Tax=Thiomicrorhabdus sediminis TaxID=2580412 RepID=A0A4P9K4U9_9GAMM|nr:bile acid:sodium symporter family protein [Thiomicrorhabdus sediminis]QCU90005.1 bile acid:sodium symporter family protein [Thiomicrorhabdus sediminis]